MTIVLTTIASILVIAAVAGAAGRLLHLPLCPICAGVGGTWLWMVVARHFGLAVDVPMLSTLLGGSVVGVAYQLERHLSSRRSPLLWKTLSIPSGFATAYALAAEHWALLAMALVVLLLLTAYFLLPRGSSKAPSTTVQELESKMKNCC
jgi:hypothetical protein